MAENEEKMTKVEAFVKKGGLRCLTRGALSRKVAGISAALLVGGAALMPVQVQAAPRRPNKDAARAVSVLGIVSGGLRAAAGLSNTTAAFLRKSEAQKQLNAMAAEYQQKVQELNIAYQTQVGTVGNDAIPFVKEYLAYRKNPSSKTPEQVAQLEQALGRSGIAMVFIAEACDAYNAKVDAKKSGKTQEANVAAEREADCLRQARKFDEKLSSMALSRYGVKRNAEGKYDSWSVLDRLDVLRTQRVNPRHKGGTDQQWLAAYEKQAQTLRKQYNAMANREARKIRGYNATIQREIGAALFGTGEILHSSHKIHRINEHWGNRRGR